LALFFFFLQERPELLNHDSDSEGLASVSFELSSIIWFSWRLFSLVQENGRKIILRLVGRGKMLLCLLGKEKKPLRQSGERLGPLYSVAVDD